MSHELLHVFEHAEGQGFVDRREVVEEFREWPAMFQVIEQSPNGHARSDEDRRAAENVWIRVDAGNCVCHGQPSPEW
jgi:hypothetical protein